MGASASVAGFSRKVCSNRGVWLSIILFPRSDDTWSTSAACPANHCALSPFFPLPFLFLHFISKLLCLYSQLHLREKLSTCLSAIRRKLDWSSQKHCSSPRCVRLSPSPLMVMIMMVKLKMMSQPVFGFFPPLKPFPLMSRKNC